MSPRFDFSAARRLMVEQQIRTWASNEPRLLEIMGRLSREDFTPDSFRTLAYADLEIPLGHGGLMERPSYVAQVLSALRLRPGERVLEVGTGSGYLTAIMIELGTVVHSVEIEPTLASRARHNLSTALPSGHGANIEIADLHVWSGPNDIYDAILLGGSLPAWEPSFLSALRAGGRLYAVIGRPPLMQARLFTRGRDGQGVAAQTLFETCLPPLRGVETFPGGRTTVASSSSASESVVP